LLGCGHPNTNANGPHVGDRTREIAANATEKAKPAARWVGRKVGQASKWAAQEAAAFVEGVFEGWFREQVPSTKGTAKISVNTASERDLLELPEIYRSEARKIVKNRPFRNTHELVTEGIISEDAYKRIRELVTVN
jgi:DNA uptake protein ComE-like DNA-binding protein